MRNVAEWSSADSGVLWLYGEAGTGNSVILAAVVDHFLNTIEGGHVDPTKWPGAENTKTGDERGTLKITARKSLFKRRATVVTFLVLAP